MLSSNLFLSLVLTCAVTTYGLGPYRGTCKKMAIFEKGENGKALKGHVISSHDVTSCLDCADQCLQNSGCRSYNYQETGSPLRICELSSHTKASKPSDYVIKSGFTYYDAEQFVLDVCASAPCQNGGTCGIDECTDSYECVCKPGYIGQQCETFFGFNGSSSSYPSNSCLNIKLSGQDTGDGRYWINPGHTGSPFTVYCDMTTDGGGWTLIRDVTLTGPPSSAFTEYSDYRKITNLGIYQFVTQPGLLQLKQDMGFTQIRYFCRKASVGRVFHIMTATNALGLDVVRYFVVDNSAPFPAACDSFVRLPDDRSLLAANCDKWGYDNGATMNNKWGHSKYSGSWRPYKRIAVWSYTHLVAFINGDYMCDDAVSSGQAGDTWKMFVR